MYKPKERKIYKFFDGKKNRGLDPLEAELKLESVDIDWEERFVSLQTGDKQALVDISEAARKVFSVEPYEISDDGAESGLTTTEVFELLADFVEFKRNLTAFSDATPTSPPSTDSAVAQGATTSIAG